MAVEAVVIVLVVVIVVVEVVVVSNSCLEPTVCEQDSK